MEKAQKVACCCNTAKDAMGSRCRKVDTLLAWPGYSLEKKQSKLEGRALTMRPTKLNLGAGHDWKPIEGWTKVDHNRGLLNARQAWDTGYPDKSFETVFCSHMFEHISHFKIEEVICEINRVLKKGGVLRILTPNLKKLAEAYVSQNASLMDTYIAEDGSGIRKNLGLGQAFMGFLVSPGYDNFVFDSNARSAIAGYGHLFSYDFEMLSGLLSHYGFGQITEPSIDESRIKEHRKLRACSHDRDKRHSLVVECVKERDSQFEPAKSLLYSGPYDIPNIGKNQQIITRAVMRVTSALDGAVYKTAKAIAGFVRPGSVNKRRSLYTPKTTDLSA